MTLNLFLLLTQHSLFWMADVELNADVFLVSDSEHSINATTSANIELTPDAFALSEDEYPIVTTTSADIELNDDVFALSEDENFMDAIPPTSSTDVQLGISDSDRSVHASINDVQNPDLPANAVRELGKNKNISDNAGPQGYIVKFQVDLDPSEAPLPASDIELIDTNMEPPPTKAGANMTPLPPRAYEISDIDDDAPIFHSFALSPDPSAMNLQLEAFEISDDEEVDSEVLLPAPDIQSKPFYHSAFHCEA
jgi:hypothetical protein